MRSKDTLALYERALLALEKQLHLAQTNLQLERERSAQVLQSRSSNREWFTDQLAELRNWVATCTNNQGAGFQTALSGKLDASFAALEGSVDRNAQSIEDKLDAMHHLAAIPVGDTPTVEEMIEAAKADPARRKQLEQTLSALEFEDPLVGFN